MLLVNNKKKREEEEKENFCCCCYCIGTNAQSRGHETWRTHLHIKPEDTWSACAC